MVAVLIGRQDDVVSRNKELNNVIAHGGHVYRNRLGQQFAVFNQAPQGIASVAKRVIFQEIPDGWTKLC